MRIDRIRLIVAAAERDLTMRDLAEKAGISYNMTCQIKRGMSCSDKAAQKIADALGMDLEDLRERN